MIKFFYRAFLNEEKETSLTNDFLQFSTNFQRDLKSIGLIFLQLLQRHIFTDKEFREWETWNPITSLLSSSSLNVAPDGSLLRPPPSVPSGEGKSGKPSTADGTTESPTKRRNNNNKGDNFDDNSSIGSRGQDSISVLSNSDFGSKMTADDPNKKVREAAQIFIFFS